VSPGPPSCNGVGKDLLSRVSPGPPSCNGVGKDSLSLYLISRGGCVFAKCVCRWGGRWHSGVGGGWTAVSCPFVHIHRKLRRTKISDTRRSTRGALTLELDMDRGVFIGGGLICASF